MEGRPAASLKLRSEYRPEEPVGGSGTKRLLCLGFTGILSSRPHPMLPFFPSSKFCAQCPDTAQGVPAILDPKL